MGASSYSRDDYVVRSSLRATTAKTKGISHTAATFAYDHDIKTGASKPKVHPSLKPTNAMRECRDSATHPVSVPIGILMDTTGSMGRVPIMLQERLTRLMGCFLEDKASGKKYLGDGYPAIMIAAVDDFDAMRGPEGTLQVGQFESGIEIDDNLTNLWITSNGGGTYEESYELGLYFYARHTVHDHWEKRGKKGHLFIVGDEHAYRTVRKAQVAETIGDNIQADIPLAEVLAEVKERYHVFFIIPNMTNHYGDPQLEKDWVELLGQQNVLKLEDPSKICEMVAGAVAICEEYVGVDDLADDLHVGADFTKSLIPLSKVGAAVGKYSAAGLPEIAGTTAGVERL